MDRRTFVSSAGALAGSALAGCLSGGPADDDESPTATLSPTATPSPSLASEQFTVENVGSGTGENTASVSFDDPVVVDGTIKGKNGCYTASLQSATFEDGTLTVVVESHEKEDAGVCTQALVDIEYRAEFTFEGGTPDRVVVKHKVGKKTTTAAEATA